MIERQWRESRIASMLFWHLGMIAITIQSICTFLALVSATGEQEHVQHKNIVS